VFCKFDDPSGAVDLTALFRERHEFRAGQTIGLVPDQERIHVFDAQSGKSLHP
jgi:multiple sugar transport system ATP-binding protein